jgi:hypothetical protein
MLKTVELLRLPMENDKNISLIKTTGANTHRAKYN